MVTPVKKRSPKSRNVKSDKNVGENSWPSCLLIKWAILAICESPLQFVDRPGSKSSAEIAIYVAIYKYARGQVCKKQVSVNKD